MLGSTQIEKNSAPRFPALDFLEADVTHVFGVGVADIEFLIQKALRRIRVSVHDDGGVMNLTGLRADGVRRASDDNDER